MAPGTGFERRTFEGQACAGPATTSIVREPFVPEAREAPTRCLEWTAYFVARVKMRLRLEMMLEGGGDVRIDDSVGVADEGAHPARLKTGVVDLPRGVHRFVATFRGERGPAYYRLAMVDELGPRDHQIAPPLDNDAFFLRLEDAARALDAPAPEPGPWRALIAGLALVLAGTVVWLALRGRRGRPVPVADLAIAACVFLAALFVRAQSLELQDVTWDEHAYLDAGRHQIRNLLLGDFFSEAWRHNYEHPPNTRWLLGVGALLGGHEGGRMIAAVESSLAAAFLFAFGRLAFGRGVGVVAGALAAVLPLWVAHGRIAGHESGLLFWWCASMLALACWVRSLPEGGAPGGGARGDSWAAFSCTFAATAGVFSRATAVWIFPIIGLVWLAKSRGALRRGEIVAPIAALGGGFAATALSIAGWPFLWHKPFAQLARIAAMWERPLGDIEVYMGKLCLPAAHYFVVAFVCETPALLLAAALVGIALAVRSRETRWWSLVCLLWLVIPFGQSVSSLRVGAARYVIQAWPALLLFAAVAPVALGRLLARGASGAAPRVRAVIAALPAILVVAYTGVALARLEPFPLDYFNELVGGPQGVAATKLFEVPWWGEGNGAAVRYLNATAPRGARVRLLLYPPTVVLHLREDLVIVGEEPADRVLVSHLQYFAKAPPECTLEHSVQAAGAPLVDVFQCPARTAPVVAATVSATQLGFAAMTRGNAVDEAIARFDEALRIDPNDAGATFGLGWASHVKGDLRRAEALYVAAAAGAARSADPEIEYFARFNLGTLHAQRGEHEAATQTFRAAVAVADRAPARIGVQVWSAWYNLGRSLAALGRNADAVAVLERARALRPTEAAIAEEIQRIDPRPGADGGARADGGR